MEWVLLGGLGLGLGFIGGGGEGEKELHLRCMHMGNIMGITVSSFVHI